METNQENNQSKNSVSDPFGSQKFKLAIIILVAYIIFIAFMLYESGKEDLIWTRMLYLFSGLEAIVFAALGYVFGKDIHRIRAEKAEENADQAKKETDKAKKETEIAKEKAQQEKEKGIQLSTAIISRNVQSPQDSIYELKGITNKDNAKDNYGDNYLVNLAKKLYPLNDTITVSFDYEISPADKIDSITINGKSKSSATGTYSGVPLFDNRFTIDVSKENEFVEWTFKITRIVDSNGATRKQRDGKLVSNYDTAYVQLEKL